MNEVQKRELFIYKEIAKICDKYKLQYFAIGGTCIGAIRHKGFIPWDDDIDIALPRKDYELFRTKYYKELPSDLLKLDYDNSKQHSFLFTKIHDSRTTFVEYYAKDSEERYTGAFVDIMPVDGLPDDKTKREQIVKKFESLDILNSKCRPVPLTKYQGSYLGVVKFIVKRVLNMVFGNYYSSKVKELGSIFDYNNSQNCIFTWRAGCLKDLSMSRVVFPKAYFAEIIEVPFEDTKIKIPKCYDAYLSQDFGDYMKLPSTEEQKTNHDVYISDMNTPCRVYAERDMEIYKNKYKFWGRYI